MSTPQYVMVCNGQRTAFPRPWPETLAIVQRLCRKARRYGCKLHIHVERVR